MISWDKRAKSPEQRVYSADEGKVLTDRLTNYDFWHRCCTTNLLNYCFATYLYIEYYLSSIYASNLVFTEPSKVT